MDYLIWTRLKYRNKTVVKPFKVNLVMSAKQAIKTVKEHVRIKYPSVKSVKIDDII